MSVRALPVSEALFTFPRGFPSDLHLLFFSHVRFSMQGFLEEKKKPISGLLVAAFSLRSPQYFSEMVLCTIKESHGQDNDNRCSFHQHSHHVHQIFQLHSNVKVNISL